MHPSESQIDPKRWLLLGLWCTASLALFWRPSSGLVQYALHNDSASHEVLIPAVSVCLIFLERKQIFRQVRFDFSLAAILLFLSSLTCAWTLRSRTTWTPTDTLAGFVLALVLLWISGFAFVFGREALKNGRFSLLFLLLMIPLSDPLLNHAIYFLQKGSAVVAEIIFDLTGVPALREGLVFHLAKVNIEVARECSGIRSSLALLILALVVGHLLLRTLWKQVVFVIAGLLIMLVKNGVRIATLTILAEYVDPGFLYGRLHHGGGVVFFLLGLLLLLPILWFLQRGEKPVETIEDSSAA